MTGLHLKEIQAIQGKKVMPASKTEGRQPLVPSSKLRHFKKRGFGLKDKEAFYLELSILLTAGVDIKSALEITRSKYKKGILREAINRVSTDVISGLSLSEAIQKTGYFSLHEYFSIMIGEETGRLSAVLSSLAGHYNKRIRFRRQLVQALTYPVVVLLTAFGAVAFMLHFIVPMFSEVFSRFGGELPALTVAIIRLAAWFKAYAWLMAGTIFLIACFFYANRERWWWRKGSGTLLLMIPIVGGLVRVALMARLAEALSLMIGARIPLIRAVGLARQMVRFYAVEESLSQVEIDLMQGQSLYSSLKKFPIYDQRFLALVKVGEESNKLEFFFEKMAGSYADEVEHRSAVLGSFLEPLIIIFLGAIVGIVLLALYLPLFELSNSFGG